MRGGEKIILIASLIFLLQIISAANVGVSPADVKFEKVLRGGYAERPITVTIDAERETEITVETYGDTASWINYSSNGLKVSKGNPLRIIASVSPPADTPNGNYSGFLRIKSTGLGSGETGHATGIVIPALDVQIITQVTDEEIVSCQASNFKISNAEEGDDVILTLDIENRGNIRINPKTVLDIWDQTSTNLVDQKEFYPDQISPTTKGEFVFKVPSKDLELGQYWVDVSVPDCFSSRTLTFDILEEGALYAAGVLERIAVGPWADIGDIVSISAIFKNTGEKALEARFVGKVTYENKIIQLIYCKLKFN